MKHTILPTAARFVPKYTIPALPATMRIGAEDDREVLFPVPAVGAGRTWNPEGATVVPARDSVWSRRGT
jgi:hypothetical protein